MQDRNKLVTYERNINYFLVKLRVWEKQLSQNLNHFPTLMSVNVANGMHMYMDKLPQLASEFQNRFNIFAQLKTVWDWE